MNTEETESLLLYYYNELPEEKMVKVSELIAQQEEYKDFIQDLKYVEKLYIKSSKSLKIPEVVFDKSQAEKTNSFRLSHFSWIKNIAVAASILIVFTIGSRMLSSSAEHISHEDVHNIISFIQSLNQEQSVQPSRYEDISIEEVTGNILVYEGFKNNDDLRQLWVNNF